MFSLYMQYKLFSRKLFSIVSYPDPNSGVLKWMAWRLLKL